MSALLTPSSATTHWQLRLPTFEGPLDVLLRLVEKHQLPISEVSLVAVTDQFLLIARDLDGSAPDMVAEFTAVGSRLVAIKARSLLPRPTAVAVDEEDDEGLVVQLLEYKAIKEAARQFEQLDRSGATAFVPSPEAVELPNRPRELPLGRHQATWLARAIQRKLSVVEPVRHAVSIRPVVTLREMIGRLSEAIAGGSKTFDAIAQHACADASDRRTMFLALLVMIRRGAADAEQQEPFGEITIRQLDSSRATSTDDVEEF